MGNWGGRTMTLIVVGGILAVWIGFFGGKAILADAVPSPGEPVPTDVITPVAFDLHHPPEVLDSLRRSAEASAPVVVRLDPDLRRRVLADLRAALEEAGADSSYTAGIERNDYYGRGIIDREALGAISTSDSMVVINRDNTRTRTVVQAYTDVREARVSLQRALQPAFPLEAHGLSMILEPDLLPVTAATDSARAHAARSVNTVERSYSPGETLLPAGGIPDPGFFRVYEAMNSAIAHPGPVQAAARLVPVLFILTLAVVYCARAMTRVLTSPFRVLLLGSIWMASLAITGLLWQMLGQARFHVVSLSVFGACLTAVFFDSPGVYHAWFLSILFSALAALGSGSPYTAFMVSALPAVSAAGVFRQLSEKNISLSVMIAVLSSVLVYWALHTSWIGPGYTFDIPVVLVLALVPFVSMAVARLLIHPVQVIFRVTTPLTFSTLLSDSHPLRERLRNEARGTFTHSAEVAELASAAAKVLGADHDLARIGAYYHDIGKLIQPGMFIENMMNPSYLNPHDDLPPGESASLVISHVRDGVKLARKHRLPREVIDIIREHHGTGLAMSFLDKARKQAEKEGKDPDSVDEEQFRYPGPTPGSIEAALVMTADAASSASRMLKDKDEIARAVKRTLKEKDAEGQYDRSGLTRSRQEDIWHVFMDILSKTDYERVRDYPGGP